MPALEGLSKKFERWTTGGRAGRARTARLLDGAQQRTPVFESQAVIEACPGGMETVAMSETGRLSRIRPLEL